MFLACTNIIDYTGNIHCNDCSDYTWDVFECDGVDPAVGWSDGAGSCCERLIKFKLAV